MLPENQPFYEFSLKLWENLENDTNYNSMVSQRGVLNLFHSDGQRDAFVRRGNSMILSGADANLLNDVELKELCPYLDFENARFPIKGALLQKGEEQLDMTQLLGDMHVVLMQKELISFKTVKLMAS